MSNFSQELINKISLFHSQDDEKEYLDEKYSFLRYAFNNFEAIDDTTLQICDEEFEELDSNIDALYYDEDTSTYNLYLAIYSNELDVPTVIPKNLLDKSYIKINNFLNSIFNFKYSAFDDTSLTFEIADSIHKNLKNSEIVVNIFSNYLIPVQLKKDNIESFNGQNVSFRTYDLKDFENKLANISTDNAILDLKDKFGKTIKSIRIASNPEFDVYMTSMNGLWLAQLYKDDSARLLEQNVRSYLKRTAKVNAGIIETVKNSPEQFVTFNNGISGVATKVDAKGIALNLFDITKIYNFQIVNGGQTTATLYECMKDSLIDNLKEIEVPIKLTVVKTLSNSESLIRNISVYSNTQTAIKKSDPPSNLPFFIEIKQLSKQCLSYQDGQSYICYFERTNGEYQTDLRRNNASKKFTNTNPKNKKFTKIDLANAINCWEQLPYVSCQGREKNFSVFNETVKNQLQMPDQKYFKNAYATILLLRQLDKQAKKLELTVKSNVIAYTLSLLSFLTNKSIDLGKIWNDKKIPDDLIAAANELMPKIHEKIINAPVECPEPRMWARKEKCWNLVKQITLNNHEISSISEKYNFFLDNPALSFIMNDDNFHNPALWSKILLWNNQKNILTKQQINMVKTMKSTVGTERDKLTIKQKKFAKDIFIFCVKNKFNYK